MMFIGYFMISFKILKKDAMKSFSNLIFYVTVPALILNSLASNASAKSEEVFQIIVIAVVVYIGLFLCSIIVPKILRIEKSYIGLYRFMTMFGNVAFVGFPVVKVVLGEDALFYAAIFNLPFNFLVFTIGIYFIRQDVDSREKSEKLEWKKFINPGIVATILGLIIFFAGIPLPNIVMNLTKTVGDVTTPLSLFVVGGSLYGVVLKEVLRKYRIFALSFIKLFILPTVAAFILYFIGLEGYIATVPIILIGMPIAANTVIISQEFDGHVLEASEAVFISTLLISISIPYLVFLIFFLNF